MRKLNIGLVAMMAMAMMTGCVAQSEPSGALTEADDPVALTAEEVAAWDAVTKPLSGAWASTDLRYARSRVPVGGDAACPALVAWRGERVSASSPIRFISLTIR